MHPQKKAFLAALEEDWRDEATHKAFADWLDENDEPEEADIHRQWTPQKQRAAERWLGRYASECEMSYADLIEAAEGWLDRGDWVTLPFDTPDVVYGNAETFWQHFQVVTGRVVPEEKRGDSFISCAC
jgi:uncharacterized protein (TIGR02996 family)